MSQIKWPDILSLWKKKVSFSRHCEPTKIYLWIKVLTTERFPQTETAAANGSGSGQRTAAATFSLSIVVQRWRWGEIEWHSAVLRQLTDLLPFLHLKLEQLRKKKCFLSVWPLYQCTFLSSVAGSVAEISHWNGQTWKGQTNEIKKTGKWGFFIQKILLSFSGFV